MDYGDFCLKRVWKIGMHRFKPAIRSRMDKEVSQELGKHINQKDSCMMGKSCLKNEL